MSLNKQDLTIYRTKWLDEDAVNLRDRQQVEIRASFAAEPGVPPSADDVPIFLIIKYQGLPIACGGLRPLPEYQTPTAEIKRMYVLPELRGRNCGVADILMEGLESSAWEDGFRILKLETATAMIHARKFYERHGFRETPLYGHYVGTTTSVCYKKELQAKSDP